MQQLSQRVQPSATLAAFLSLIICVMCIQIHHEDSAPLYHECASARCGSICIWCNCHLLVHELTLVGAVLLCTLHNVATIQYVFSDLFALDPTTSVHGIFLTKHTVNIIAGNLHKFTLHTLYFPDCLYCLYLIALTV